MVQYLSRRLKCEIVHVQGEEQPEGCHQEGAGGEGQVGQEEEGIHDPGEEEETEGKF